MGSNTEVWTPERYKAHLAQGGRKLPLPAMPIFTPQVYEQTTGELIIEIEPMGAPRMVQSDKWKSRPVVERYHALKDKIRHDCELFGYKLGAVVKLRFELSMPDSWSDKKKAAFAGMPHQQKPDVDNLAKAWLRCL